MSDILKESRVRGYYQDGDLKITIEKKGLFNKKRKVYTTFWGSRTTLVEREPEVYGWATIEFTVDDLTEDNNFGEYQKYYEAYIKERDQPKGPFKAYNSFERNNLEFSKDWNSDLDIIKLYILINTEKYKEKVYEWALLEEDIKGEKGGLAPYYRSFGSDGYYLNNGTSIRIDWIEGTYVAGNESWSDAKGNELGNQDLTRWNTKKYEKKSKGYFDKVVSGLWAPEGNPAGDSYMDFTYEKSPHFSKERLPRIKYGSSMKDTDILNQIVSYWKQEVPGYESLAILKNGHGSPAIEKNESKETLIEYKSPFGMSASGPSASGPSASGPSASEPTAAGVTASSKLKPTFKGIADGFQITAKTDMPNFSIYVGDPEKWPVRENIEEEVAAGKAEDFEDVDGAADVLDEEFSEEEFVGDGEVLATVEEYKIEMAAAEADAEKTLEPSSSVSSIGSAKGLAPNTPLPSSSSIPAGFNNTPLYSQYDTRWAKSPYDYVKGKSCGDNSTVASSGCGPSAVSMVINYWASKGYCDPVTPAIVAKFFADFGGRVCGSGSGLANVPKDKFKSTFGMVLKVGVSEADLMTALRKGYPCVISGKGYTGYNFSGTKLSGKYGGGHFVCLTGIDAQGRIRVNDSGNNPSGGKAITAFLENKSISSSTGLNQKAILYPSSMAPPV